MSFQRRPPLRRQTSSESLLSVGGMTWDLSNLCSVSHNDSYSLPPNGRPNRIQSYGSERWQEQSIYPNKEDLGRYLPADIDTSDIFDRSGSPPPPSPGVGHRAQGRPSCAKNKFDQLGAPSAHDRYSQPLSSQAPTSARDADEISECYYEAQGRDYSSRWEVPHDPTPNHVSISDCSSDVSSPSTRRPPVENRERKPVHVEVYPGEFYHLRDAKETIEAVEQGYSQRVFCYACGLGLRCVADCELVICPDCRIMSPVPRRRPISLFVGGECDRGSLPQFTPLWTNDDESFHSSKQKSNACSRNGSRTGVTGGVGLGLRIEED
jgi:hypothetical protein